MSNSNEATAKDRNARAMAAATAVTDRFEGTSASEFRDETRVVVPAERIYEVLEYLRDAERFELLVDITCPVFARTSAIACCPRTGSS